MSASVQQIAWVGSWTKLEETKKETKQKTKTCTSFQQFQTNYNGRIYRPCLCSWWREHAIAGTGESTWNLLTSICGSLGNSLKCSALRHSLLPKSTYWTQKLSFWRPSIRALYQLQVVASKTWKKAEGRGGAGKRTGGRKRAKISCLRYWYHCFKPAISSLSCVCQAYYNRT